MNSIDLSLCRFRSYTSKRLAQSVLLACATFVMRSTPAAVATQHAPGATGVITGIVTNRTTGNGLEGARVELPQLGLTALVDTTGRYLISGVPAGTYEVVASYFGLDSVRASVTVPAGQRAARDFDLTGDIYLLDPFKVAGEREGNAAAITQQRNADNVKNVVAMDAYGNLPNLNATELAVRLPGVTFSNPGTEVVEVISVRGMGAGLNTITIDGGLMSSFGGQNRETRMTAFTGAMFEALEVIKGHTPDKSADSLGGTVNFKTRSPLSMREKRRISYTLAASHAASFTEQVPLREAHRTHPLFNGSYMEKFRVFGSGEENLAVSVNAFYSENAFGFFQSTRDFQQTASSPAYLWDYRTLDNYNNRRQVSVNTKWDYRPSLNTLFRLNLIYNDAPEPKREGYQTRAFAGSQTTVPSAATGIVPGAFTDRITVVRALAPVAAANAGTAPAAAIDVNSNMLNRYYRLRHADLAGEHKFGAFEFDWAALFSRTRYGKLGGEGSLTNRIGGVPVIGPNGLAGSATNTIVGPNGERGVGWILDRTQSDLYPRFLQNGGLDFTNPNNYRPTQNGLTANGGDGQEHRVRNLRGNVKYKLPIDSFTAYAKTGADLREQTASNWAAGRRWSYIGRTALPTDPSILLWDQVKTGRNIPVWNAAQFVENGQPKDPSLWQEDLVFHEQSKFTGKDRVQETAYAAYALTQGKFGNNGFLAGVRGERTDTVANAYARERVSSTPAQQLADPVGTALRDYGNNWRVVSGSYTQYFPSIHLWRNFTPNLKARTSWSTSFGRPDMANALPTETANEAQQTLTIGNPALLPQTAKNWDLAMEYYFEPSGSFSVGWFHKTIEDFILNNQEVGTLGTGTDNGYNGQYPGFILRSTRNAGTAVVQGWEFSYLQRFSSLPALWKTLSLNANLTIINTHGDFGATGAYRGNNQVAGFIPKTANVNLSWQYRKFGTRVLWSFTDDNVRTYNSNQPSRSQYMLSRELVNLGCEYHLSGNHKLTLDIANLFNAPQRYYRSIPDQLQNFLMQGTKVTMGIQGRF